MDERSSGGFRPTDADCRVQVPYTAPVEVIVDMREGKVDSVVILDEWVTLDLERGVREENTVHQVRAEVASRAIEIASASKDWPRWRFGF